MVCNNSDTKSLIKIVMQEVVLKDWSEQERLNDLFEVTQFPNCLCERGGKKVEAWWVIDRL